jgi:hypothetical protein
MLEHLFGIGKETKCLHIWNMRALRGGADGLVCNTGSSAVDTAGLGL